jgi:hypothetical protein
MCYDLDLKCPHKDSCVESWSPRQQYPEVGLWGSDWIMRASDLINELIH